MEIEGRRGAKTWTYTHKSWLLVIFIKLDLLMSLYNFKDSDSFMDKLYNYQVSNIQKNLPHRLVSYVWIEWE